MSSLKIVEDIECEEMLESNTLYLWYAWGHTYLKTWFITKTKTESVPPGSTLIYVISGRPTNKPLFHQDTFPKVGDISADMDRNHLEIIDLKWV